MPSSRQPRFGSGDTFLTGTPTTEAAGSPTAPPAPTSGERSALIDAGEPFGPRTLRHTFATQMVRDGVDLVIVADLLGHTRLETTRLYTKARELHQTGGKPQVTRSAWQRSGIPGRRVTVA